MAISEKIELLGKGLYKDIPGEITITSIPTVSELDYVGSEDYDETMLTKIFPQCIQEKFDYEHLLEIDYQWICRCLRLLNYGPYYTVNSIYCPACKQTHFGEYRVNLETIVCKPLPEKFVNDICIEADRFIDFDKPVHIHLMTIREAINAYKDQAFKTNNGRINREFARMCYCISRVGNGSPMSPIEAKLLIENEMSSSDYIVLRDEVSDLSDYGLRAGGAVACPGCGSKEAAYIALMDDRFFRPTVGDLREWKRVRNAT